jgi:thiamine phosphate synthase YjbQ (UPF0047 family)
MKKMTIREIETMLSALINKVNSLEDSIYKVLIPGMTASMNMFEIYVEMKGDLNKLVEKINEKAEKQESEKLQKAGETEQTEGSGAAKRVGSTS